MDLSLLGAPLSDEAISFFIEDKTQVLGRMISRLSLLPAHCGFFLLRNSLAIPKLVYLLRCSPTRHCVRALQHFVDTSASALESLLNVRLEDSALLQSSLPVGKGGLGVRHAVDLALPAFLASVESVRELVKVILATSWFSSE
jgi:hypothetical protein